MFRLKHNPKGILPMKLRSLATDRGAYIMSSSLSMSSEEAMNSLANPNQHLETMDISLAKKICVKSDFNEKDCYITGLSMSSQNKIFVADYQSESIKMIDIQSGAVQHVQLETSAGDVTIVTDNKLAVTIPLKETIQFISYTQNRLFLSNRVQVNGWCQGICHYGGKLAVIFKYPNSLKILNLECNVLTAVTKRSNGENIFRKPDYITSNNLLIYVSDLDKKAVLWFNWNGELLGSYTELAEPHGVALLDNGTFLVIDKDRLVNVSRDGKKSKTVLDDLESPRDIVWCARINMLCVSNNSKNWTERNFIQMYCVS